MKVVVGLLVMMVMAVFVGLLISLPVMWLWNWLMPLIFGLMTINFWQSLGLSLLCGFLFKSSGRSNKKDND